MRLDHIAYRVADRHKTAQFFIDAFGYKIQQEFKLDFGEGKYADCIALEPPEKKLPGVPWVTSEVIYQRAADPPVMMETMQEYHLPPEIFVSDGNPGSIVGDWVAARGGIGGIHHIAYQVDNVYAAMRQWKEKGFAEFSSDEPMACPGLTQIFTKPSELTGVIYEFIKRDKFGFCRENVKALMESTKEN
jgi:catechol 2,3-dioxygenase-like lactoylglutathione lyase family enzyme